MAYPVLLHFKIMLWCSLLGLSHSAEFVGSAHVPTQGSVFLEKFCFDYDLEDAAGEIDITFHASGSEGMEKVTLALFDDQSSSYPRQADAFLELPCDEQLKHSRYQVQITSDVRTEEGFHMNIPVFERIRPRWWYIAVLNCGVQDVDLAYTIHTTNPTAGWQREFSVDHYGVARLCLMLLVIYSIAFVVQLVAINISKNLGKDTHPLVQYLIASVGCSVAQVLALCIYYIRFSWTGQGVLWLYILAKISRAFSKMFLMAILFLISQGRCVSTPMVISDAFRMFRMVGTFVVFCVMLELWSEFGSMHNYTTDYVYSTTSGQLLVFIDICLLSLYLVNLHGTRRKEIDTTKQYFYSSWGALYSTWFLVLPVMTLAASFLGPWLRFKVVFAVSHLMNIFMYGILIGGLWPTKTHSHFALDMVEMEPLGAAWERLQGELSASS